MAKVSIVNSLLKISILLFALVIVSLPLCGQAPAASSQATPPAESANEAENDGVPVFIDGRPILLVYSPVAGNPPDLRAEAIKNRLLSFARDRTTPVSMIRVQEHSAWSEIVVGNKLLMSVMEGDAQAAGRNRQQLALEYAETIKRVITIYRQEHTWPNLAWAVFYTALLTVLLWLLIFVYGRVQGMIAHVLQSWITTAYYDRDNHSFLYRMGRYLAPPILATSRMLRWIVYVALLQIYATVVLRFFPATRFASLRITNWLFLEVGKLLEQSLSYLPNLLLVFLIGFAAYYLVQLNKYFFSEIQQGRVKIAGFYLDWAQPTAKLVRLIILMATAVIIFPYLPGSNSPAFRGISVFVGVLLSLGSTSAVANVVAGTILTYMRAFQIGDWVRIGDHVGEILEKNLLVTRVRTSKKEVITIPNGNVMAGVVINYSAETKGKGVIFHTTVTIGYDAPWRIVHDLLMASALVTKDILHDPPPFVYQTTLNDFYVAYELNAYTANPHRMEAIYSELHQNIQDKFNEAGVEINSPHYTALRDGNKTTIPESYLGKDYKTPVFVVGQEDGEPLKKSAAAHGGTGN